MTTTYRRILVIDNTNGNKSSFINRLPLGSIINKIVGFQETDIYEHNKNLYKFIIIPRLQEEEFCKNAEEAKYSIRERLLNYEKDGLHLIIFYTNDKIISLLAYNTFNFIVWTLTRTIPVVSLLNKYEHEKNVSIWKCQDELTNYIGKHCVGVEALTDPYEQSDSMREIWKIIEKYALSQHDEVRLTNVRERSQEPSKYLSMDPKAKEQNKMKTQNPTVQDNSYAVVEPNQNIYEKSMYNPSNTHIERLKKIIRAREVADKPNNCVLIITGSFNPIHRSHLLSLYSVKQYLEKEIKQSWNVLMGYISPSHDKYVLNKLGKTDLIPSIDRCKLCDEAIKSEGETYSSWIEVSDGESQCSPNFVNFDVVTENLRDFLNTSLCKRDNFLKYPLKVVYVCGLDHYNKCTEIDSLVQRSQVAVGVIHRFNQDEKDAQKLNKLSNAFYIQLTNNRNKDQDISSTQIRNYYRNFKGDASIIPSSVCATVHYYMLKHYKK